MIRGISIRAPNHFVGAAAVVALGALALWPWVVTPAGPSLTGSTPGTVAKAAVLPVLPPVTDFSAIADRPLFSPSRRPSRMEAPAAAGTPFESRYRLIGLVTTETARRAWLADGARHFDVGEGDTIDGWKVMRVERDRLLLSSPAGQSTLTLKRVTNDEKQVK